MTIPFVVAGRIFVNKSFLFFLCLISLSLFSRSVTDWVAPRPCAAELNCRITVTCVIPGKAFHLSIFLFFFFLSRADLLCLNFEPHRDIVLSMLHDGTSAHSTMRFMVLLNMFDFLSKWGTSCLRQNQLPSSELPREQHRPSLRQYRHGTKLSTCAGRVGCVCRVHVLPAGVRLPLRNVEAAVIFRPIRRAFSAGRICDGEAEITCVDAGFGLAMVYLPSRLAGRVPETGTLARPAL